MKSPDSGSNDDKVEVVVSVLILGRGVSIEQYR
jgi:hypothetical protein